MRRMLALPRIAKTLRVMGSIGLIDLTDDAAEALGRYENIGGRDVAARLVLLAPEGMEPLRSAWRLANAEVQRAEAIAAAAGMLARDEVAWAAYRHGDAAVEGLAVAAARENWSRARLAEAAGELARLPPR